ncbi:MAG: serine hydrolase [Bacteroidetes bacterium]|nr:serine hydrolase [Bacteroidota bacterium]
MKIKLFTFLFAFTISLTVIAQSAKKQVKSLDDYIENALTVWNPPGLAVTVVKDGEIVFTKGYGERTLGEGNHVNEHTLFGCMSTTKAFTAAAIAILIDEGKLNWDDHVINYLPDFQLYDPYMTRELTVKDLLTHRSGIGNTDYLWSWMKISGDSALYKMRDVKPSYSLRSSFIYQNLMYLAAGKVIEKVSEQSWGSFLKNRIYIPLGMNETFAKYEMVKDKENKADAHFPYQGEIVKIDQLVADEIGPAGSMWSSINDIGKWVKFLLNNGIHHGDTLISNKNFKELFKPQQIIPTNEFYPTQKLTKPNWMTYGLGWFQHDYRGKMVQFHTGSLPGMVAIVGLIPEENIGVYVMGNLDHVELRHAIMYTVFDLFLDGEITRDWSTEFNKLYANNTKPGDPKRILETSASLPIIKLLGTYKHKQYGNIEIIKTEQGIRFNLNNTVKGTLSHWHYDTYNITFDLKPYGKAMLTFRMNAEANAGYLEIFGERFEYIKLKE